MADYTNYAGGISGPAFSTTTVDVSSADHVLPKTARAIYVGTSGNVTVRIEGDTTDRVYKNLPNASKITAMVTIVRKTGTSAADMIAEH